MDWVGSLLSPLRPRPAATSSGESPSPVTVVLVSPCSLSSGPTPPGRRVLRPAGRRVLRPPAALLRRHLQVGGGQPHARAPRGMGHLPGAVAQPLRLTGEVRRHHSLKGRAPGLSRGGSRCGGIKFLKALHLSNIIGLIRCSV